MSRGVISEGTVLGARLINMVILPDIGTVPLSVGRLIDRFSRASLGPRERRSRQLNSDQFSGTLHRVVSYVQAYLHLKCSLRIHLRATRYRQPPSLERMNAARNPATVINPAKS